MIIAKYQITKTNMSLGLSWLTRSGKVISLKFLLLGTEKQCHLSGNKSFFLMLPCPPDVPTTLQIMLRGKRRELISSPKTMAVALDKETGDGSQGKSFYSFPVTD